MESSVDNYIAAQPESVQSFDQFWQENNSYGTLSNPDQFWMKFLNFFTGENKRVERAYDAYLNNVNNRNEFLATQSARAYDRMMDDTKYQRMMKDFEAAGLNPYLLVNNGGISASAPSSSKPNYDAKQSQKDSSYGQGRNIALLLLAVARVAAALL